MTDLFMACETLMPLRAAERPAEAFRSRQAIQAACRVYQVSVDDLRGDRRHSKLVRARCAVAVVLKNYGHCSYSMIGRALNRDHTTIINLVRNVFPRLQADADFLVKYDRVLEEIGQR